MFFFIFPANNGKANTILIPIYKFINRIRGLFAQKVFYSIIQIEQMHALLIMAFSLVCLCDYTQPPKNIKYSLSPTNLIDNPRISWPDIGGDIFKLYAGETGGWKTKKKYV